MQLIFFEKYIKEQVKEKIDDFTTKKNIRDIGIRL